LRFPPRHSTSRPRLPSGYPPDILARYSPAEIKAALTYLEQAVDKIKVRTGAFVKPEGAAAATMIADDLGMFLRDAASRL
jgi:hypothetical protein